MVLCVGWRWYQFIVELSPAILSPPGPRCHGIHRETDGELCHLTHTYTMSCVERSQHPMFATATIGDWCFLASILAFHNFLFHLFRTSYALFSLFKKRNIINRPVVCQSPEPPCPCDVMTASDKKEQQQAGTRGDTWPRIPRSHYCCRHKHGDE